MRTDIVIDRKQVQLPYNGGRIGFEKWKAQFGDVIFFKSSETITQCARVVGRIAQGSNEGKSLKNYLVVICLGQNLTHIAERWVAPEDVVSCFPAERYANDKLKTFFSPEFVKDSTDALRQKANTGSI